MFTREIELLLADHFQLQTERHRNIMATLEEVKASLDDLTTTVATALTDLTNTGAAGHAAVLDEVIKDISAAKEKIKTNIAAVPTPNVSPK